MCWDTKHFRNEKGTDMKCKFWALLFPLGTLTSLICASQICQRRLCIFTVRKNKQSEKECYYCNSLSVFDKVCFGSFFGDIRWPLILYCTRLNLVGSRYIHRRFSIHFPDRPQASCSKWIGEGILTAVWRLFFVLISFYWNVQTHKYV